MKFHTLALIFIGSLLVSCDKDSDDKSSDIVPMRVGNSWTYDHYEIKGDQELKMATLNYSIKKKISLNIKGEKVKAYVQVYNPGRHTIDFFMGADSKGYYKYGYVVDSDVFFDTSAGIPVNYTGKDTLTFKSLHAKYPANPTDNWNSNGYDFDYIWENNKLNIKPFPTVTEVECLITDKEIKTDCGDFNCFGYKYDKEGYYIVEYYAVGFGLIKREVFNQNALTSYEILTKFTVN